MVTLACLLRETLNLEVQDSKNGGGISPQRGFCARGGGVGIDMLGTALAAVQEVLGAESPLGISEAKGELKGLSLDGAALAGRLG